MYSSSIECFFAKFVRLTFLPLCFIAFHLQHLFGIQADYENPHRDGYTFICFVSLDVVTIPIKISFVQKTSTMAVQYLKFSSFRLMLMMSYEAAFLE
ncbi:hypothetical protein NPIL_85931 [Nephila pilipes]|uniref:Uncharacterized protein n=1 Tax=Nephila pilipes TaxID=299642 RepID=A0A8X6UTU3_NEPPI|nr:hypothetical protein NPIL_85931 [Nephila pilipes]